MLAATVGRERKRHGRRLFPPHPLTLVRPSSTDGKNTRLVHTGASRSLAPGSRSVKVPTLTSVGVVSGRWYPARVLRRIRSWFARRPSDCAEPSLTPHELFLGEFEALARAQPDIADVERVDAETAFALDLTTTEGETHRLFLNNIFVESRDLSPDERRKRALLTLASLGSREDAPSWDDARNMLIPILRGVTFPNVKQLQLLAGTKDASPGAFVRTSFAPFIDILPVIDSPTQMTHVHRDALREWNLSEEAVLEAALARFGRVADRSSSIYDRTDGPLFVVSTDDMCESSRLLIPGWLASFRGKVEGAPVAIIPHAALLLVGGSARPTMISRLVAIAAREFDASPRHISPALYTVDEHDLVVPYVTDAADVCIAEHKLASWEYTRQKQFLDESQDELFIANYLAERTSEGRVRSLAVWTDTVDTLLPKTDCVSLVTVTMSADGTPAYGVPCVVPWDAVAHRLTPATGFRPTRFRTGKFPREEELAALRSKYSG
jgi:uncharacterized protein YtpQ (UPF0354 family)